MTSPAAGGVLARLHEYQKSRFPLLVYLPTVGVAAFCALAWSGGSRGRPGFSPSDLAVASCTLLAFFFLLRVFDEHKDAEQDALFRPELPVPSGLITLRELRWTALVTMSVAGILNFLLDPILLAPLAVAFFWASLMAREFFVGGWLRKRPGWYLASHMIVMPLLFLYASAVDWLQARAGAPTGLGGFLAFTFLNGLIIEVGRKLKSRSEEREGVDTYTNAWGVGPACVVWLLALALAWGTGIRSAQGLGYQGSLALLLAPVAVGAGVPAVRLLMRPEELRAKHIETASGLWVMASYLGLGVTAVMAGGPS